MYSPIAEYRIYRVSRSEVHLAIRTEGSSSEHVLAAYDYHAREKGWSVRLYDGPHTTKEELQLVIEAWPVKGRHYPKEEDAQAIAA